MCTYAKHRLIKLRTKTRHPQFREYAIFTFLDIFFNFSPQLFGNKVIIKIVTTFLLELGVLLFQIPFNRAAEENLTPVHLYVNTV